MKEMIIRAVVKQLGTKSGQSLIKWQQDRNLRRSLHHAARNSPFYRRKFAELGLPPDVVRTQEDLPKLGFFTTPADLQVDPFDFLAVPKHRIVHIMATTGTTGKPKITFYSKRDWDGMMTTLYNGFIVMGIGPGDVAQIMMCAGTPTWMGGTLLASGLERRGVFIVPMGNTPPPEKQLEAIVTFGSNYLFGTASYVHRLTEEGKQLMDLRSLGIKSIYVGSEPNSKAFRNYLEEEWGAKAYDGYGMMEMGAGIGGECPEQNGLHLGFHIVTEVIDPKTGEPVHEGESGELVFTTVSREATPLIRYRSGDIARMLPDEPCPCRRLPTRKISHILGRADDMTFLGTGENIYPEQVDRAIATIPGVSGYQLVIDKDGYKDSLLFRVEAAAPSRELAEKIKARLYSEIPFIHHDVTVSQTIMEPVVEFLAPGTFVKHNPIKTRRLVDNRNRHQ